MGQQAFMEFITHQVEETTLGTQAWGQIVLPTSANELLALLLHDVTFHRVGCDRLDGKTTQMVEAIALRQPPSYEGLNAGQYPDVIADVSMLVSTNIINAEGYIWYYQAGRLHWHFDPPILIAQDHLYHGVVGIENTALRVGMVRLGYTLEKVSREAFIASLVH